MTGIISNGVDNCGERIAKAQLSLVPVSLVHGAS